MTLQPDMLDVAAIKKYLPHRYPFLLVDRVLDYQKDTRLHAIKNVTANEPHFTGHFPEHPVMPGVLITEALAQACGLLAFISASYVADPGSLFLLAGMDNVRFKQMVVPGDQLHLHVQLEKVRRDIRRFTTRAEVDGNLVCSAEMLTARTRVST